VSTGVVVVLEVVDVEHDQGKRISGELGSLELQSEALPEEPVVVEAGEGVRDGAMVRSAHPPGQAADAFELEPEELLEDIGPLLQELAEAVGGNEPHAGVAGRPHSGRAGLSVHRRHLSHDRAGVEMAKNDLLPVRRLV
jgi:hypothetical protein